MSAVFKPQATASAETTMPQRLPALLLVALVLGLASTRQWAAEALRSDEATAAGTQIPPACPLRKSGTGVTTPGSARLDL